MFYRKSEPAPPPPVETKKPTNNQAETNRAPAPVTASGGLLSRGVSIKGIVKFRNELLIDGEVEGEINSTGSLTVGEHASIKAKITAKSVKVKGTVQGNIVASERCELQAGCTLKGDIEAPRLVVDENASFLGSAKVATGK